MDKAYLYLQTVQSVLADITDTGLPQIERLGNAFASALEAGRNIFLFGTGHSHMLSEELFYRAGGLVNIRPVLYGPLMLHESASKSTQIERQPDLAEKLFADYGMRSGDVIVIISNSGRNGVCIDMAMLAKTQGLTVAALTNLNHSKAAASRHPSGKKLYELADIVLDNGGCLGDAAVPFEGLGSNVAPTSTVIGAAILNAAVCACVETMLSDGVTPEVFSSSNVDGGDEINQGFIEKYKDIRHL